MNFDDLIEKATALLGLQNTTLVGIDIGLSAVKFAIVESGKNTYHLKQYLSIPLPEAALIEDEIQKPEEIQDAIERGLERLKIKKAGVAIGLSGPNTTARRLQLPGGSAEEIEDQVAWEAEQYLPFAAEDSAISHDVIGENDAGGVIVVVAGVKNETLLNFKDLVEELGHKVKVVTLDVIAFVNVFEELVLPEIEDPSQSIMALDIGAQKINMVIHKSGHLVFSKEINIGSVMITEELQRQMSVNYEEAEDLKINTDASGNLPEEVVDVIDQVCESIFAEIKKTYDFYQSSTSDDSLQS